MKVVYNEITYEIPDFVEYLVKHGERVKAIKALRAVYKELSLLEAKAIAEMTSGVIYLNCVACGGTGKIAKEYKVMP